MSRILYTFDHPVSMKHLQEARQVLSDGGLVAYPTDVNWACGCLCDHKRGCQRLQKLKISADKPITFIFPSLSEVSHYAQVESGAFRVLKKILPGPYTVILESHRRLPKIISSRRKEIGIRIPQSELLMELTQILPAPLATIALSLPVLSSSAQLTYDGQIRPRFGYEIADAFAHQIDLILDLSTEVTYQQTSVIRLTEGVVEVIRQGDHPLHPLLLEANQSR